MGDINATRKKALERAQLDVLLLAWNRIANYLSGTEGLSEPVTTAIGLVEHFSPKLEVNTWLSPTVPFESREDFLRSLSIGEISLETGLNAHERVELSQTRAQYLGLKTENDRVKGLIDVTPEPDAGSGGGTADPLQDWLNG